MKLYVGTYSKYNDGNLFGEWVDLANFSNKDEFYAYCKELHKDEEDAEFMFQDYEDMPEDLYSESGIDAEIWEYIIPAIKKHGQEKVFAYFELFDDIKCEELEDRYYGEYENDEDFAQELLEQSCDLSKIPTYIQIDWEGTARGLMYDFASWNGFYFLNH